MTWEVALIIRLAKAILCMPLALFGLLVAVDNVIDYGTNYAFVQHVFSMDTTIPGNALLGRAITNPVVWQLGYGAIIVGEALTGLCFLVAALTLMANLRAPPAQFARAKTWAVVAGDHRVLGLVSGLRRDRRGVVRDVAIPDLEWPGTSLPLRDDRYGSCHFRGAART